MKETNEEKLNELRQYAKSIGMTSEEYVLSLHKKNQAIKSIFLENGSAFKAFVSEYHDVLEGITTYKETDAKKESCEHYKLIRQVTELLSATSQDPKLLAQLSQHFPDGIDGKIEELNNPTT